MSDETPETPSGFFTPDDSTEYRTELTPFELAALDPRNPAKLEDRIRVVVPESGNVDDGQCYIITKLGEERELLHVIRCIVSLEASSCPAAGPNSKPGTAVCYITRWNAEIGRLNFIWAPCILGFPRI